MFYHVYICVTWESNPRALRGEIALMLFIRLTDEVMMMMMMSSTCLLRDVSLCSPVGEIMLSGCEMGVHTIDIQVEKKSRWAIP